MDRLPIVLLHGYSASQQSFRPWHDILVHHGYDATTIHLGDYVSLSNEITIKDIAEGLDRALREEAGLGVDEPFDAIVHSTGGLVIREWLATYERHRRLKRMIALAPATFGSPLAHRGQSWLAAVFKGERELGPDFMETGRLVLSGLELASRYTWDLAHRDLLGGRALYDASPDTPFPFVFVGLKDYGALKRLLAGDPGSDGTVRWAGVGFNCREIIIDLTREPGVDKQRRFDVSAWHNIDVPLTLVPGLNHGTIVGTPSDELVAMVIEALQVSDLDGYRAWAARHSSMSEEALGRVEADRWQQFVVRLIDERGDPVPDYYVELVEGEETLEEFAQDVHPFTGDPSLRCFHVNLTKLEPASRTSLELRLGARSGTDLVAYHGVGSETFTGAGEPRGDPTEGWDARIDLTGMLHTDGVRFFFPYTTTLVEIRVNREPMPLTGVSKLFRFAPHPG